MISENLEQILKNDRQSKKFFESLSPELQSKLLEHNPDNFKLLKSCAENYCNNKQNCYDANINPACSSNECTGLIPNGENKNAEDIRIYKEIFPFGDPNQ